MDWSEWHKQYQNGQPMYTTALLTFPNPRQKPTCPYRLIPAGLEVEKRVGSLINGKKMTRSSYNHL
jgi:hypothetical protein